MRTLTYTVTKENEVVLTTTSWAEASQKANAVGGKISTNLVERATPYKQNSKEWVRPIVKRAQSLFTLKKFFKKVLTSEIPCAIISM